MKKILVLLAVLLASPSYAVDLIATATGDGGAVNTYTIGTGNHTVHGGLCYFTDANTSISALTVAMDGTIDGTNWAELASHDFTAGELTALSAYFSVTSAPIKSIRFSVSTLTGADSTDTIYCDYAGQ